MRKLVFISLVLFSGSAFATVTDDAITVLNILSGKTLNNAQLASIADKYNESWGSQWTVAANPYDPETQSAEYAAWPGNATAAQKATFLLQKIREETRSRLYRRGLELGQDSAQSTINATAQSAADEL